MKVLVTGAKGFVGQVLCAETVSRGLTVRGVTRSHVELPRGVENFVVSRIDGNTDWRHAMTGCASVVHLAARAHVMKEVAADPLDEFRRINVQGTLNLAQHAAAVGVRRFVFISSIGVNGAQTFQHVFTVQDAASPHSPYAVSKYEAELGLQALAAETGMEVVLIRPPLVYGPKAPGNFGALMRMVQRGYPLPLGAIHNQRSLIALDNLVDFIVTCITHPKAANQTFLISDGQDLSTTELVQGMAQAAGLPVRLLPMPVWALEWAGRLVGKRDTIQRLCGNLQIDSSKARELLNWVPKISVQEGLRRAMNDNLK